MNHTKKGFTPLEVASPRSSRLAPKARARLLTGFTLVEIMVVMAIIVIVSLLIGIYLTTFSKERHLRSTAGTIVSLLRSAQQRSLIQENGKYWGVKFENLTTDNRYTLFSATDTALLDFSAITVVYLRRFLEFLQPPVAGNSVIIFDKISGNLINNPNCLTDFNNAFSNIKVHLRNSNASSTVNIYCNGKIE